MKNGGAKDFEPQCSFYSCATRVGIGGKREKHGEIAGVGSRRSFSIRAVDGRL